MSSSNRIRVLQFLVSPVRSGAEEVALELVRRLDPQKFRNYLVCPAPLLEAFGNDWRVADSTALPLTVNSPFDWDAARKFASYLRSEKIDIVHAHMIRAATSAVPLARLAGVPVVIHTCHGREAWRKKWLSKQYWIDRRISSWSQATIAVSESTRDFLLNEKKIDSRKVMVIRNGRHLNGFAPDAARRARLRQEVGFGPSDPIMGVFGRLEEQKGHRYLIEALPKILASVPPAKVLFAGDGALRRELEESARALGLENSLRFLGYRRDWMDWMDVTDVVVLPSLYEGMPLVPIEAAAMAKPVVATAVDGTCEVVVNGKTGILVPAAAPDALADALIPLLQNPECQKKLGEEGKRRARDLFSLERQIQETAELYERLLGARGRSSEEEVAAAS